MRKTRFAFIPPGERRFWRLFRHLIGPIAVLTLLMGLVLGLVAAFSEGPVIFLHNHPVTGWEAIFLILALVPVFAGLFSIIVAWTLYIDRTILPALSRGLRRLFRRM